MSRVAGVHKVSRAFLRQEGMDKAASHPAIVSRCALFGAYFGWLGYHSMGRADLSGVSSGEALVISRFVVFQHVVDLQSRRCCVHLAQ
jgi:hypothetical protein